MRNAELYLKEASYLRLSPAYSKIARTSCSVKDGKTRLLPLVQLEHGSYLSIDYWSSERWYEIVEVQFAEMTGTVATKQASVTSLHVSIVWALLKNKASHHKKRQRNSYFLSLFFLLSIISAFVIAAERA